MSCQCASISDGMPFVPVSTYNGVTRHQFFPLDCPNKSYCRQRPVIMRGAYWSLVFKHAISSSQDIANGWWSKVIERYFRIKKFTCLDPDDWEKAIHAITRKFYTTDKNCRDEYFFGCRGKWVVREVMLFRDSGGGGMVWINGAYIFAEDAMIVTLRKMHGIVANIDRIATAA